MGGSDSQRERTSKVRSLGLECRGFFDGCTNRTLEDGCEGHQVAFGMKATISMRIVP